jgi:hypothetical protein
MAVSVRKALTACTPRKTQETQETYKNKCTSHYYREYDEEDTLISEPGRGSTEQQSRMLPLYARVQRGR